MVDFAGKNSSQVVYVAMPDDDYIGAGEVVRFRLQKKRIVPVPAHIKLSGENFVRTVLGDSMQCRNRKISIEAGWSVVCQKIHSKEEIRSDAVYAVRLLGGEEMLRKVRLDNQGMITLIANNPKVKNKKYDQELVEILGVVIYEYKEHPH